MGVKTQNTHICRLLNVLRITHFLGGPNRPKICVWGTKFNFKDRGALSGNDISRRLTNGGCTITHSGRCLITGATPHHNKDRDNLTPTKLNISLTREGGSSSYVGGKSDPTKWLDSPNLSIIIREKSNIVFLQTRQPSRK